MTLLEKIHSIAKDLPEIKIMEVCGGHTNTIMKYGIRDLLPENIKLISGPGCPVCVTSQHDIDSVLELARRRIKISVYGDMINVPGTEMRLSDAQSRGADIKAIYSVDQIMDERDRIFFAVGFETTIPMTAKVLEAGIPVFSAHKLVPPALLALIDTMRIDGFIDPGHVSTIIGSNVYNTIPVPQVISGFQPEALLESTYLLLEMIKNGEKKVINNYPEVVHPEGNLVARSLIEKTMKVADVEWRGLGIIPQSGLIPRDEKLDARLIYRDLLENVVSKENPGCRCGEVIKGLIEPQECALYGKICTPENPQGACMVSVNEGACAINYKYSKKLTTAKLF